MASIVDEDYHNRIWEQINNYNGNMNKMILDRLKEHTDMSDSQVDEFAYYIVAADYFKLPDHRGGAIEPGTKHYRADGTEYTIADVPYRHVVREAIKEIQKMPEDRRTEAYKKVVDHISGIKKTPDWEREPVSPNAEPATAFSTSKAV